MKTDKLSPKWLLRVKASIRPFITYIITVLYFYVVINFKKYGTHIVDIVYSINYIILLYWYSERILRNVGITDLLTKGEAKEITDNHDPKWINSLKATVRPFLTYAYTGLFIYVIWKHSEYKLPVIRDVANILLLIIVFWFGERWLRNVGIADAIKGYLNKMSNKSIKEITKGK